MILSVGRLRILIVQSFRRSIVPSPYVTPRTTSPLGTFGTK